MVSLAGSDTINNTQTAGDVELVTHRRTPRCNLLTAPGGLSTLVVVVVVVVLVVVVGMIPGPGFSRPMTATPV